ncbi:MAG: 8-oxoguanine deaminase [Gammaproteobacteria bacterium]|nr:8-oxoguanine deaminase [Gammaproteobacteria bacterium]MDH5303429.1 8-oxoguanine deaminase [Gammaproteobacteria bacterium]MDH5321762.1 8-oxoguanine deaminase [Gammaproteobacteria bacterium]
MRTWIRNALAIWTGDDSLAADSIVIAGSKIEAVLAPGVVPAGPVDTEFDASGLVITPGLVNCHHHFYQTLTRAFPAALDKELFAWLVSLYPVWAGLQADDIAASTELALAELMLSGCTTTTDHHYLFTDAIADAIDLQVAVAKQLGVRVILTRGSMSVGKSDGGLPPDHVVQDAATILEDSERLILKHHEAGEGALTQIALAPCSPFSVSPQLMRDTAALARKHNVLLHTHLGETEDENAYCEKYFGQRPVDFLADLGWLADDVWLAHGIHFTDDEVTRLGAAGVGISHCPHSNMLLASGVCRTRELEAAGVSIGLGVDGSASNDSSNLMQELRQAFLLQRMHYGADKISHHDALRWATRGGAKVLHRPDLGLIAPGQCADLAMFDLDELRFSGSGDPVAALILCGAHRVRHLLIDGEWRVRNGEIPGLDLAELQFRHRKAAARLAAAQG